MGNIRIPTCLVDDLSGHLETAAQEPQLIWKDKHLKTHVKDVEAIGSAFLLDHADVIFDQLEIVICPVHLWMFEAQLVNIYVDVVEAESAHDMLQEASMKDMKGGCVIQSRHKQNIISDTWLMMLTMR